MTELRTERLRLIPLTTAHAGEYAAFIPADEAERETAESEAHWAEHAFGPWAVLESERFVGFAEVHYAGAGVGGIDPREVEVGWVIAEDRRGRGLATEAMRTALADAWTRAQADHVVAYIRPENPISLRVAEKLGFRLRGPGRARSGDPVGVYVLDAPA